MEVQTEMQFESLKARKPSFQLFILSSEPLRSCVIIVQHSVICCFFSQLDIDAAVVLLVDE